MTDAHSGAAPIGLLGGTFDPVHCGHLRLALEILEAVGLEQVRLIPAQVPNHRPLPTASSVLRLEMLRAASDDLRLVSDPRELERDGVSYTVETLESLRQQYPMRSLCLILGQDAFNGLPGWHRWRELLELAHIVVATRPGYTRVPGSELDALIDMAVAGSVSELLAATAGRLYFEQIPLLPISSTDIRQRVRQGRSIDYLVPPGVQRIIQREGLYRS